MKKMVMLAAAAAMLGGCRVVEVDNRGEEVARDQDGKPVLLQDGSIQTVKKGWSVYHNQHWMVTEADSLSASVKKDEINFALNGLNSRPDGTNLVALVDTSFSGVNTLVAKVAAAVATSGGSTAGDAALTLATSIYNKFKSAGGDESKATVSTSSDGKVTVSDGTISATASCADGSCTVK